MLTINAPRVYLLCMATWAFCGSLGWMMYGEQGLAAGIATASLIIGVANLKD